MQGSSLPMLEGQAAGPVRSCWGLCCRDCFKAFYTHKFRAVLGKNRLIFPGEKVEYVAVPAASHQHPPSLGV